MRKNILFKFLLLLLFLTIICINIPNVFAEELLLTQTELDEAEWHDNIRYIIKNNEVIIVNIIFSKQTNIPEEINGYPVTTIHCRGYSSHTGDDYSELIIPKSITRIQITDYDDDYKFYGRYRVAEDNPVYSSDEIGALFNKDKTKLLDYGFGAENSYIIPEGVVEINDYAFEGNKNLKEVKIPETVTSIGAYTFMNCKSLEKVNIPMNIKEIKEGTFKECENLKSISLPANVISIGDEAFADTALTDIVIPDGVKKIGTLAFHAKLKKINIPNSVEEITNPKIGGISFSDSLMEINVEEGNPIYSSINGILLNYNQTELVYYPPQKKYLPESIPKNVKVIRSYALSGIPFYRSLSDLDAMIIPEGIEEIEADSLPGLCRCLVFPSSIKKIEDISVGNANIVYGTPGSYIEEYIKKINEEYDTNTLFLDVNSLYSAGKSISMGYRYNDNYFDDTATKYNHHLATSSLLLAYSAYNANPNQYDSDYEYANAKEFRNVEGLLARYGFMEFNSYHYDVKPTVGNIAFEIANKELPSGENLIAIVVRGGGYEVEWESNFNVNTTGNHAGFTEAANQIYEQLKNYVEERGIHGKTKIWITGFSRAAATSNLLAAKLDTSKSVSDLEYTNEDIYAYCFATPAGADTLTNNVHASTYDNIFSIIHYHDPVPLVAPSYWNFDRYGKTLIFPFRETTTKALKYEKAMKSYLKEMTGEEYEIDDFVPLEDAILEGAIPNNYALVHLASIRRTQGRYLRDIINSFALSTPISTRELYYNTGIESLIREHIKDSYQNESSLGTFGKLILELKSMTMTPMGSIIRIPKIDSPITPSLLVKAHAEPEYYLAWMESMNDEYVKGATPKFMDGSGRIIKINCPVDVYVYDSNENLVASIVDEKPQDIGENAVITSIDENGQKIIYLPKDEEYNIKIIARENCKTTVTINEYSGVSSDITNIISYSDVKMKKKEKIILNATNYTDDEVIDEIVTEDSGAIYQLQKLEKILTPEIQIKDKEELENNKYSITTEYDENQGTVIGGGLFYTGDFCQGIAEANEGYEFDGWYVNNKKVSEDSTYRFAVSKTETLQAKFKLKKESLKYTITFDTNDGSSIDKQIVNENEKVIQPENPTKEGYTFEGWYKDKSLTIKFDFESGINKDTIIYAKWLFNNIDDNSNFDYIIEEGLEQNYIKNSSDNISIKTNGDATKFVGLKINGIEINKLNYTISLNGVIKLNNNYLNSLSEGIYRITIIYNDGSIDATITIKSFDSVDNNDSHKNKDEISNMLNKDIQNDINNSLSNKCNDTKHSNNKTDNIYSNPKTNSNTYIFAHIIIFIWIIIELIIIINKRQIKINKNHNK